VGVHDVTVSVDDGNGGWASSGFVLTVTDVPDAPEILTDPPRTTLEDVLYQVTLEAYDPDPGDVLTWIAVTLPDFLDLDTTTLMLSGVPGNGDVGDHDVSISVTDRTGNTAWLNYTLTVVDVTDPPWILTGDVTTATENVLYEVFYEANVDPGDELTWSFETDAGWLSFDSGTGRLWGTPGEGMDGAYYVNLTVQDVHGAFDVHNFTLTVEAVNDAPMFGSEPPTTAHVGVTYEYHAVVNDVDSRDLVLRLDEAPAGMTITEQTGYVSWIPQLSQLGEHQVTINVTDGIAWALQRYVVTVTGVPGNSAPSFISTPSRTVIGVGEEFVYTAVADDEDGGDTVTYVLLTGPGGMTIGTYTGGILWTPGDDDVGEHDISILATDGRGGVGYQNFTLTVEEDDGNGNGVDGTGESGWLPVLIFITLVLATLGAVVYHLWRRSSAGKVG
jgi:hypothetical protein